MLNNSPKNRNPPNQSPLFLDSASVPKPKFRLFEVVIVHSEGEGGWITNDLVQIVGLAWCPDFSRITSWWYHIRYLYQPDGASHSLPAGHQEDCPEAEIRRIEFEA